MSICSIIIKNLSLLNAAKHDYVIFWWFLHPTKLSIFNFMNYMTKRARARACVPSTGSRKRSTINTHRQHVIHRMNPDVSIIEHEGRVMTNAFIRNGCRALRPDNTVNNSQTVIRTTYCPISVSSALAMRSLRKLLRCSARRIPSNREHN